MRVHVISAAIMLGLVGCTNTDNPQLAMCQAVIKQLTNNSVSSWDKDSNESTDRQVTVKVAYTNSSGQAGTVNCFYPKHQDGTVDTAPARVVMNNQPVDQKTLISVGTKASGELLAGTYKNTVEKSTELAKEAADKAGDLAVKASAAAAEGAKALQQLQQQ